MTSRVTPERCGPCLLATRGCAPPTATDCMRCDVTDLLGAVGSRSDAGPGADAGAHVATPLSTRLAVLATACMACAALLWGTSFFFIDIALTGFDAVTITVTRCLMGGLVVGILASLRTRAPRTPRARAGGDRSAASSVGAAGLFTALALFGVAVGQGTISSSVAGIVLGTVPVWTAALVAARGQRSHAPSQPRDNRTLLVAIALGIAACVLPSIGADTSATTVGIAVLFAASISHAASMVAAPRGIDRFGPIRYTSLVMLVAGVVLSPLLLFGTHEANPDAASLLALLEVALLPTGIAYIAFYRAVALLGAARATIAIYLIPLVAMLTGTLVGGESLTIGAIAGGACALAAVGVAVSRGEARGTQPTRRQAKALA